jgi:23S rRNA (guanosine2251-2'-O)-methyltransferase
MIWGINPVLEALRAGRVTSLRVSDRASGRVIEVVKEAEAARIPIRRVPAAVLERDARGGVHQGVMAEVTERPPLDLSELLARASGPALLVVLDSIEDPQNVGAILRTVDAVGAHGVVRQSRHAAPLEGAAAKASAGAISHVPVAEVVNIARAIEELKSAGVWTVGLVGESPKTIYDIDLTVPTAVVLGAEGTGLRRLVRERCDWQASIPMRGHVQSLNVSVAAGVALFEALRQRLHPGSR